MLLHADSSALLRNECSQPRAGLFVFFFVEQRSVDRIDGDFQDSAAPDFLQCAVECRRVISRHNFVNGGDVLSSREDR
jgi:hypothetical protein